MAAVRVAAVAVPQSPADAVDGSALASIAETDANGQYRLENIPPGRYYVAAGRLDLPTYHPGTQEMNKGTIVAVTAGSSSTLGEFRLQETSGGRMPALFGGWIVMYTTPLHVPIDLRVEGGEKMPVFGPAGFVKVVLEPVAAGTRSTFFPDVRSLQIPGPGPSDYRVSIENLPDGYSVKSMTYGSAELSAGVLHLSAASFAPATPVTIFGPAGAPLSKLLPAGASPTTGTPLAITLSRSVGATDGARVRGSTKGPVTRSIYLSGRPGILFSDGTFEFRGVPPGRHVLFTMDGSPLAATVVVGNADLDGIELEATSTLPVGIQTVGPPVSGGDHAPGSTIPLSSLRGKVVDQDTRQPLPNGMVFLSGGANGTSSSLKADGTFELSRLLPGSYLVEFQSFAHETVKRAVVVGDDGANVEIEAAENRR